MGEEMGLLKWILDGDNRRHINKLKKSVEKINALESHYAAMSDDELRNMTDVFKAKLRDGATLDDILCDAFAVVREASKRVTG